MDNQETTSLKIALAQQNYHIGNISANTDNIINAIQDAKSKGAQIVVFSELSVCGYPPGDFLYFDEFIDECYAAIDKIKTHAQGIAVLVGAPERNKDSKGKRLHNAAWFLADGQVKQIVAKTCLPTYDVFDEDRYFESAVSWNIVEHHGRRIAVTVCEDIWNIGDNPLYPICPMDKLIEQAPDLMINLSASPFDYTHDIDRQYIVKANVLRYKLPMFYCNSIGSQTEIVFDGNSLVFDKQANLVGKMPAFEESLQVFSLNADGSVEAPVITGFADVANEELAPVKFAPALNIASVHQALVLGIRDYFQKQGFKKAILGSSGGVDSAITLALACEALGKENVIAVLMPSEYSTSHSVSDAEQLSKNLGNEYHTIPIASIYNQFLDSLSPLFKDLPFGLAEENTQSRTRGNLLMSIANKFNYILLNTSNKSELATGYGTLYGDMAGGLGVLGDCYKLQVYELGRYLNRNGEVIPENILTKAPSAELRPGQKDSDSLPDYAVMDGILYQYIDRQQGPDAIKAAGFDAALTDRILGLVNRTEYKRKQFCPVIRISAKAFGVGRRMPVVAKYF